MSTQSQLAEIESLLAATPDDPSLLALKDDLMQLIALEEAAEAEPSRVATDGENTLPLWG